MKPLLVENELTEMERELLESAGVDTPSRAARAATMAALGLGATGALASVAGAAHGAKGVAAALPAAKVGGTVTAVVVAKWLGVGAVAGAVLAGGVSLVTTEAVLSSKPAPVPAMKAPEPVNRVAAVRGPEVPALHPLRPQSEVPSAAEDGAGVRGKAGPPALGPVPASSAGPSTGSLGALDGAGRVVEEVASLDRVRAALSVGDANGALGRLAVHERRFPAGALEPEAVLLRVRALVQLGQLGEARKVARRFLAAHPGSAQASRLEALIQP